MHVGQHSEAFGRVDRLAFRKLDQDVDRIGAGQLDVEPLAGARRLLAIRHLVGQPVAWFELRIAGGQRDDQAEAGEAVEARMRDHADGDPAAEAAQDIQRGVDPL